jgi:membrane protease YdiL (CAAX protease family)
MTLANCGLEEQKVTLTTQARLRPGVPFSFFALTFGFSWALWAAVILTGRGASTTTTLVLFVVGTTAPSLAGIALTYLKRGLSRPREFWSRAFDPRRLTVSTGLLAVGFPVAVSAVVAIFIRFTGADPFAVQPAAILGVAAFSLVSGGLNEELGWRGYALEPLQQRFGSGPASTILGLIWASWHLPLFLFVGTAQSSWGFGPFGFWAFAVMMTANSVVIATIYNRTRRSTLSAIGYHWAFNFSTTVLASTPNMRAAWALIAGATAIVLLVTRKVGVSEAAGRRPSTARPVQALDGVVTTAAPVESSR